MPDMTRPAFQSNPVMTVSGNMPQGGSNIVRVKGHYEEVNGKEVYVQQHNRVKNITGQKSLWDINNYSELNKEEFNTAISKPFKKRFGVNLTGFTLNELPQIQYIYEVLSLVNLPMKKVNRVFHNLHWDVHSKMKDVTAYYDSTKASISFFNVVKYPEIYRQFDAEKLDTAFSETLFHELGHAIDFQLDITGMVSRADRNLFARLCGWKKYSDKKKSKLDLLTPYAQTNPSEALAEYFGNYITHQSKVHELLKKPDHDQYIYIYSDEIVRDIRPEYHRFSWVVHNFYQRFIR